MSLFTLHQNLVYGYGAGTSNPKDKGPDAQFHCRYGKASYDPTTFRNECVHTADRISKQASALNRTPVILLSGGLDSEVVVKSFIEAGVPFEARTLQYPAELNGHELSYVRHFLSKNPEVRHEYYDLDILKWCKSVEARDMFQRSYCSYFEMVPTMKLCLDIWENDGFPIFGNGEVLLLKTLDRTWQYVEYEYDLAWYRFAEAFGIDGAMGFFQHTPEIMIAALQDSRTLELYEGRNIPANVTLQNSSRIKYGMYRDHWPELLSRQKHDGGERLRHIFKPLDKVLSSEYSTSYDDKFLLEPIQLLASLKSELI